MPATPPTLPSAGLLRRIGALVYDLLLLLAALMVVTALATLVTGGEALYPAPWWYQLLLVATWALFWCGFWVHGGQTLGMKAWHIRVRTADGRPLGWREAGLRLLAAVPAMAPAGVGLWWLLFDSDRLAWHDRLSRTRVVVERPPRRG